MDNYNGTNNNSISTPPENQPKPENKWEWNISKKTLIAGIVVFILIVVGTVAFFTNLKNKNNKVAEVITVESPLSLLPQPESPNVIAQKDEPKPTQTPTPTPTKSKLKTTTIKNTPAPKSTPTASAQASGDKTSTSISVDGNSASTAAASSFSSNSGSTSATASVSVGLASASASASSN